MGAKGGDEALEERIKVLEEAVRKSSGRPNWVPLLKLGAICVAVVLVLLVCLGPLLPAVYTLEYVAKGGAFR